jgi:hypothetical protein
MKFTMNTERLAFSDYKLDDKDRLYAYSIVKRFPQILYLHRDKVDIFLESILGGLNQEDGHLNPAIVNAIEGWIQNRYLKHDISVYMSGIQGNPPIFFVDSHKLNICDSELFIKRSEQFNWPAGSSGSSQLSFAICLHFWGPIKAYHVYDSFKWLHLSGLPNGTFTRLINIRI